MEKKLSAYQKLKAENLKLKQDIYVLTQLEKSNKINDVMSYFSVKTQWDMRFELENIIWGGAKTSQTQPKCFFQT